MDTEPPAQVSAGFVAADLFAGGFGGAVGVLMGQPFDFLKVRLQTLGGSRYAGALDCLAQTLQTEGVVGMYRGVTPPVLNSFVLNAITFGAYNQGNRLLEPHVASGSGRMFLAGSYAGLLQVFALVPMDIVKCRMQMDRAFGGAQYAGPIDCARQIFRAEGVHGFTRGFAVSACRDSPTMGIYFLLYEKCVEVMPNVCAMGSTTTTLTAGGVTGTVTWALAYPFDTLKTHLQTLPASAGSHERGMLTVAQRLVYEHGVSSLYRGLSTCLVRAFPVNAVTFLVYKRTLDLMGFDSSSSNGL